MGLASIYKHYELLWNDHICFQTGRGVPVIVPEEAVQALEFIASEDVREKAGINHQNPFLFAKRGSG